MFSSLRHRNNKQKYYLFNYLSLIIPNIFFRIKLKHKLSKLEKYDKKYISDRVNYYNKLSTKQKLTEKIKKIKSLKIKKFHRTYFFDSFEIVRYFDSELKIKFLFGDIVDVPEIPSIVKSRPISKYNHNSVLLKLNKVRHFTYTNDNNKFEEKKDILIGRSAITKKHKKRIKFFKKYFNHKLCDLGAINKNTPHKKWIKNKISIEKHLKYKFIMCIEGVDVATNLKWVMSSNSIAVMPRPSVESWFMEQKLIPDYHYIEIDKNFTNLEERLDFFIKNPSKCHEIIKNANSYVKQFKNKKREELISLLVLEKYFYFTSQKNQISNLNY